MVGVTQRKRGEADRGGGGGWKERSVLGGGGGHWPLNGNSCFCELTSNFPFFSRGSTWASLDIAASLFGIPSPSISSTIITVSHFPKLLAGNMSDLMLSPKYTTCKVKTKRVQRREDSLFDFNTECKRSKTGIYCAGLPNHTPGVN